MSRLLQLPSHLDEPSSSERVSAFDFILPPQVIPLVALLLIVFPIVCLTGKSLFLPLITLIQTQAILSSGGDLTANGFPVDFYIKIIAFVTLSFLGCFQLLQRIKSIYLCTWAKGFSRPHPLHVDYQSDFGTSMIALVKWKLFQFTRATLPPLITFGLTGLASLVGLYLFNTMSDLPFIMLSIQITIEIFVVLMLCMLTVFIFLNSLWMSINSIFGDIIAVTEPGLSNKAILHRCGRIAFSTPYIYIILLQYLLLFVVIIAEVSWLVIETDINQLLQMKINLFTLFLAETLTLAMYLLFLFCKLYTYHHCLVEYYKTLPVQLKDCFTPPPARP